MGRVLGPLRIIILQLFAISCFGADDQVRQVQEELRKRHLFYGNADGELSPALSAAISHYQKTKGFAVTGTLDAETRASLGLAELVSEVTPTPVVVVTHEDVRGGNGEVLPSSTALFVSHPSPQAWKFADVAATPSPPAAPAPDIKSPSEGRLKRVRPKGAPSQAGKTTNPFVMAYQSVDNAIKFLLRDTQPKRSVLRRNADNRSSLR